MCTVNTWPALDSAYLCHDSPEMSAAVVENAYRQAWSFHAASRNMSKEMSQATQATARYHYGLYFKFQLNFTSTPPTHAPPKRNMMS